MNCKSVPITIHHALHLQGEQGLEGIKGEIGEKVFLSICICKDELCS